MKCKDCCCVDCSRKCEKCKVCKGDPDKVGYIVCIEKRVNNTINMSVITTQAQLDSTVDAVKFMLEVAQDSLKQYEKGTEAYNDIEEEIKEWEDVLDALGNATEQK
jgi:hypothetical protein